jgi:hypothetical protein
MQSFFEIGVWVMNGGELPRRRKTAQPSAGMAGAISAPLVSLNTAISNNKAMWEYVRI